MTIDEDFFNPPLREQREKYKDAFTKFLTRWFEESDLDDLTMGIASIEVMNRFFGEGTVEFDDGEGDDNPFG